MSIAVFVFVASLFKLIPPYDSIFYYIYISIIKYILLYLYKYNRIYFIIFIADNGFTYRLFAAAIAAANPKP